MILPVSLCMAAASAVLAIWLMIRVGQVRSSEKVSVGDGGNEKVIRRMRAHANFVEQAPFALALVGLLELAGKGGAWLPYVAAIFILGRIAHAFGMEPDGFGKGRINMIEPGQVLYRVTQYGHLPIQHGGYRVQGIRKYEVAQARVPPAQHGRFIAWLVGLQPIQGGLANGIVPVGLMIPAGGDGGFALWQAGNFSVEQLGDPAAEPAHVERELERAGITDLGGSGDVQRRNEGRDWPLYAQTMIGRKRTRNVRRCVEAVLAERIPGDLIEAGCWRGGTVIMMRGILKAYGVSDRIVYGADSFEGLPKPDAERFPADRADINYTAEELKVPIEEVEANLARYGLNDGGVRLLEGWFRDTLPTVGDRQWALVRLDGDLYESTMDGLVNLYPKLSPGGFLIIDDYGWENCRQAVDDYRREHGIGEAIERIDWVGAFWRKAG